MKRGVPSAIKWDQISTDRLSARYVPLLRLAKLFTAGESPDVVTGADQGFALLFDMNELFEAYIGAMSKVVFGRMGLKVNLQGPRRHLAQRADGADAFALRPDIVISRGLQVLTVIDTKWKRLMRAATREGVNSGDAYQMHAYATQYAAPEVMLLYPHHAELGKWKPRRAEYLLNAGDVVSNTRLKRVTIGAIDLADLDTVVSQLTEMFGCLEGGKVG